MNLPAKLLVLMSLIFSIQIHAQITEGEVDLKVQSRVGKTYIGVLGDGKMAAIVCSKDFFGGWSADLVFSVKQDSDQVPEMTLEWYRATRLNGSGRRSPFVELTSDAATQFCQNPAKEFVFKINPDRTAAVSRTISPSTLEASSDR
jgi:hypothetical protein